MSGDIAVVMDVAGTILKMYRVAKDIGRDIILKKIVTWELIMEKRGRALVVPQIDPKLIAFCRPDDPLCTLIEGREDGIEISCSSSPISKDEAVSILRRSQAKVRDLQEVHRMVLARCPERYQTLGMILDEDQQEITYSLGTGGIPFPGLQEVLSRLECMGADVYFASGDSMRSLVSLRDLGINPKRVYPVANPRRKQEIVAGLKKEYRRVIMVGDGLNDLYALKAADLGVLTVQQDTHPAPQLRAVADEIIKDIQELPEIVRASELDYLRNSLFPSDGRMK